MIRLTSILFFVTCSLSFSYGQQITLVTALQDSVQETSGLIYLNGRLITHNDSGGGAILHELDSISGNVTRSVVIENATNTDWEDLCYDSTYIYIADFGNNHGNRINLRVYRLLISDYFTTPNDTVTADTILFSYANQTNFTPSLFATNFDAETLISYGDSLFIFTKNWVNNWTDIYVLPKTPGTYQAEKIDSIDAQGLITGGIYNTLSHTILLSGYISTNPFIVEVSNFTSTHFSDGTINRYMITPPLGGSTQIEGIARSQDNQYYLTAEMTFNGAPALYRLNRPSLNIDAIGLNTPRIYPNPSTSFVQLKGLNFSVVEIYDALGRLQKTAHDQSIWIEGLAKGTYFLVAKNTLGKTIFTEKMIIQ